MYRVELKVERFLPEAADISVQSVPNVPCGVERVQGKFAFALAVVFLMYRVELKA